MKTKYVKIIVVLTLAFTVYSCKKQVFIPDGDFQLQLNDKAIVLALPQAKGSLDKLFH